MTTEERVLKLENAFSTLAQLAAESNERTSTLAQLAVQSNERTSKLEQNGQALEQSIQLLLELAARQDTRTSDTEHSIRLLLELAQTQSSRIDDHDERQRQVAAHLDVLGERMTELAVAQANTEQVMSQLAARVDHLSETVERYISGKA